VKFVVTWQNRDAGTSEAGEKRVLEVFSKWTPTGATFHQFLGRVDGDGGFAVVETDDPLEILRDVAKFQPWLRYEVYPVVDVQDFAVAATEGVEFRDSVK